MRKRVYISGPITKGDREHNFQQSCDAMRSCMDRGLAPLNPMLSMKLPFAWDPDISHDEWLAIDFPWVAVADAVLRLPGDSKGADAECDLARDLGIPIFTEVNQLENYLARA